MKPEEIIADFAKEKGILAGICDAKPLDSLRPLLNGRKIPFVNYSTEERLDPRVSFPGAKSIVVIAVNYRQRYDFTLDDKKRGKIASYAAINDYHFTVKELLTKLCGRLPGGYEYAAFSDTGPLPECWLAQKAGLGFIGKNGLLITREFGTYVNLGYLITNLELDFPAETSSGGCGECNLCVMACPGGAIHTDSKPLDFQSCASFITQSKTEPDERQRKIMGKMIYGCEACQAVCPRNSSKPFAGSITDIDAVFPEPDKLTNISKAGFTAKFSLTPVRFGGIKLIRRNAEIVSDNIEFFQNNSIK